MKVRFKVTGDLIANSLKLPARTHITEIERDGPYFVLTVAMSPMDDERTFDVEPIVSTERVTWNWRLPIEAVPAHPKDNAQDV